MVRRMGALLLALLLMTQAGFASADIIWEEATPAQKVLREYIEKVNGCLTELGEMEINTRFEMYPSFAVLGITVTPGAETPEGVEITVMMFYDALDRLELRVSEIDRFPAIAAAFIQALYGEEMTADRALSIPLEKAERAKKQPTDSFSDEVEELNGVVPRVYFTYEPNPYHDGVSWMQMTMIFPLAGQWDGKGIIIGEEKIALQDESSDASEDYEGYFSADDYSHIEVFTTATPEPDSAAAEYDFR